MFVAVRPPEAAVEDLDSFLEPRRPEGQFRWVLPEQWHLTLAFLEDVPDRALDELVERLERAARKRTALETAIAGGGAFPNVGRAKVLWAGLDLAERDREELRRLATGCRAAAAKSGIDLDGQRFRAHLTLARTGRPIEATRWVRLLDGYHGPGWQVAEIALVASYLGEGPRNRPRHETVRTFPLEVAG
ncbi:MAG TPA: RNA 2',3'-cyclic phosphodiesterase [Marmoricola sp.]|nr:RNA 2',3'-cyclic phosphodiesterase [Marmoricola sp.]